jgi:hypothetical protein
VSKLEHALAAAARGHRVHPLHNPEDGGCSCGDEECRSAGKHPRLDGWQNKATTDVDDITEWWMRWPEANIGIAVVKGCGYWIVDIDPRNDGFETVAKLEAEHGALPGTYSVMTGGDGVHLYFKHPAGEVDWRGKIGKGIDVKGTGGKGNNLVGPGSVHFLSGKTYSIVLDEPVVDAPAWLLKLATKGPTVRTPAAPPVVDDAEMAALVKYAQHKMAKRSPGVEGQQGGTAALLAARFLYVELALPDSLARPIYDEWLARCVPPWTDEYQIQHKIDDAMRSPQVSSGSGLTDFRIWRSLAVAVEGTEEEPEILPIRINEQEHDVVDAVVENLAAHPHVYHKAGFLTEVIVDEIGARLRVMPNPRVRETITACCVLQKWSKTDEAWVPSHPTDWLVAEVAARGSWPVVKRIEGVIESPTILPDGRILQRRGYDATSGLYLTGDLEVSVPDKPTRGDAERSAADILDLVSEFDFAGDAHRSAWLCAYLTVMARHAFQGPSPLMLFDAPVAASGKTKLVELISIVARGRSAARTAYSDDDAETRKKITTEAMAGTRMMLFDNIENGATLKSPALDSALTSDVWSDRVLGANVKYEGPLTCVWFATGNNLSVGGDLARRVLSVRLEPKVDAPERRSGFQHPDLEGYARRRRDHFIGAALTILRAHHMAGRPSTGLSPWGSFEGWSNLPRAAVAWCGLPDPGGTREQFAVAADRGREGARKLVTELNRLFPDTGFTTKMMLEAAYGSGTFGTSKAEALKDAIEELANVRSGQRPTYPQLGYLLRKFRDRRFDGMALINDLDADGRTMVWYVRKSASSAR